LVSAYGAPPRIDVAAQEDWKRAYTELRAQCIRATDAPPDLRIGVWVELLDEPFNEAVLASYRGTDIDLKSFNFEPVLQGAEEIGRTFPDSENEELRNCVGSALSRLASRDPAAGQRWATRLETSPNAMIRSLATGSLAVNRAQAKPVEMSFTAIDGREVNLARLRGKVVLLEFRGVTWCGACREEEPFLRDIYAKYRDKGLEIVCVTFENKESSRQFVLKYLADRKLVWPHYFDGKGSKNPFIQQFGITGVPRIYVLDQSGKIVGTDVRGRQIEPAVRALLGLPMI
jgi:peroxiredoxin